MKLFRSIRWRLQLWHGLLLVLVLVGFGFTAWRLQQATQLKRVDQELERRIAVVAGAIRRGGGEPGRTQDRPPPRDRQPGRPSPVPPEIRLTPRDVSQFEGVSGSAFYYVAWLPGGGEISRSSHAPPIISCPSRGDERSEARTRGPFREYFHFTPAGDCILVGRDVHDELAGIRRFAWFLAGAGGMVLLLGLAVGWWVSTRALRPIAEISAAATKISTGDITQRIQTSDTSSELGELAQVLNDTFDRLQASFARQAQFTADASHELRTPISVVLTQTQAALARERTVTEYRECLAACQRAAQRMRKLTESLLTLARLDSGECPAIRELCDLGRIARDATELLRPLAGEQRVALDITTATTPCAGNAGQLGQVVTNLVGNAISYNRPGGSVHVRVSAEPGSAVLVVTDTGQGIASEDLPHIFDRFYRADKARSGATGHSGLGLAITKSIVDAHGGTIEVASALDQGSSFTVRLPVSPPRPELPEDPE